MAKVLKELSVYAKIPYPSKDFEDIRVMFFRTAEVLKEYREKLNETKQTPEEFDKDMGAAMLKAVLSVN